MIKGGENYLNRSKMRAKLQEKLGESLASVIPITAIVLVLSITIAPMSLSTMALFIVGALLLIFGMSLFSLGVDMAMTPFGENMGIAMTKSRRVLPLLAICFVIGVLITIAEPDLQVLAEQVSAVPNMTLIITVAVGVGIFLVFSMLRMLFKIPLKYMLFGFYIIVFGLLAFAPNEFIPVAFDSGGVTTGPITVPFILALGVGMASIRSDKSGQNDSFGLVSLASIGPIIAVLILGIVYQPDSTDYSMVVITDYSSLAEVVLEFLRSFPSYIYEVSLAFGPIIAVFIIFNLVTHRFRGHMLVRIIIGFIYTFIGLILFLTGVNVGFMPAGTLLGWYIAESNLKYLLIPLGMIMGWFTVIAEPSVHVLNRQVEEITNGAISHKAMNRSLSIGVAIAAGLAMTRVLTGISILWFLIPGYAIALLMAFFTPPIFTGIAFDSGGVASGPMTATFLLPFAMGACDALGGNMMLDAFGVVAMVAMTPLITIQILGLAYKRRMRVAKETRAICDALPDDIIDYEEVIA